MIKLAIGLLMLFIFSCSKSTALPTDIGNQRDNSAYDYLELADQGYGPAGSYYLIHSKVNGVGIIILVNEDSVDLDTCVIYRKY